MSDIKRFHSNDRMSEAVVHNGIAFLAGQVAKGADITEQTRAVLSQIDALLDEVGSHKSRILSAQILLADIKEFADMNVVWEEWTAKGHTPARATLEAALASPEFRVEIIVIAAL